MATGRAVFQSMVSTEKGLSHCEHCAQPKFTSREFSGKGRLSSGNVRKITNWLYIVGYIYALLPGGIVYCPQRLNVKRTPRDLAWGFLLENIFQRLERSSVRVEVGDRQSGDLRPAHASDRCCVAGRAPGPPRPSTPPGQPGAISGSCPGDRCRSP